MRKDSVDLSHSEGGTARRPRRLGIGWAISNTDSVNSTENMNRFLADKDR
jgi:hypothetical protein